MVTGQFQHRIAPIRVQNASHRFDFGIVDGETILRLLFAFDRSHSRTAGQVHQQYNQSDSSGNNSHENG